MGFRFRQRIKLLPGIRVNVTANGLSSLSIGGGGATVNIGKGMRITGTASLPGTGLSYQQVLHPGARRRQQSSRQQLETLTLPLPNPATATSAPSTIPKLRKLYPAAWSSPALKELEDHIVEAQHQRQELEAGIGQLGRDISTLQDRVTRLDKWYRRWFQPAALQSAKAELASLQSELADAAELLEEQSTALEWSVPRSLQRSYDDFCSAIGALMGEPAAWRIRGSTSVDRMQHRTAYGSVLDRTPAGWGFGWPSFIPRGRDELYEAIPSLWSDDFSLFFFPTFVAVERGSVFGLLHPSEITFDVDDVEVVEQQPVPGGSVTRHTWRYVNKDGSPDRRFNDNPQFPVLTYTKLNIAVDGSFNETFHFAASPHSIFVPWFALTDWFSQAAKRQALNTVAPSLATWQLREEEDGSYLAASIEGREVFAFAFLRSREFWVGLSGEALHTEFVGGDPLTRSPTTLALWFDSEPVALGSFSAHDCRVTASQAAFKAWPLDQQEAQALWHGLEDAAEVFLEVEVRGETTRQLRLPMQEAHELILAVRDRVAMQTWQQGADTV